MNYTSHTTHHVILTRFAVRLSTGEPRPTKEWVERRVRLFDTYCVPSVEAQTRKDFIWLLFLDSDIAKDWLETLSRSIGKLENARFVEVDGPFDVNTARQSVLATMPPGTTILITSRLDNDDAISDDYVERLRSATVEHLPAPIVFTSGLEAKNGRLYRRPYRRSPFASLAETVVADVQPTTVLSCGHEGIDTLGHVIELGSPPSWLQTVHDDNVLNRVRGIRTSRARLSNRFTIRDSSLAMPENPVSFVADFIASVAILVFRVITDPRKLKKVIDLTRR